MKANQRLIDGLREAAVMVTKPGYNWGYSSTCNCGMLAQALGIRPYEGGTWSSWWRVQRKLRSSKETYCKVTGIHMSRIYEALAGAGVEDEDYDLIEFAGLGTFEEFMEKGKIADSRHRDPTFVSKFLSDLADKLELELKEIKEMKDNAAKEIIDKILEEREADEQPVTVRRQ